MSDALRILSQPLGGSELARAAQRGDVPESWYPRRPRSRDEWRRRVEDVRRAGAAARMLEALSSAMAPEGQAAARLARVARENGVVVTTGQQPGLFGGPMYTLLKALAARALADAIEQSTGVPTAPVFWAATDDGDLAEASFTVVALPGGPARLAMTQGASSDGVPMSRVPLGDVSEQLSILQRAAASALDPEPLEAARRAYRAEATVGGAYVELLRALLQPLGIAVLDASHPALVAAADPLVRRALGAGQAIADAVAARDAELSAAGYEPQVAAVEGLTNVFVHENGAKRRLPIAEAAAAVDSAPVGALSPNVLLRPVVERAILPTVAYVAGPGELSYFAQVSAVAEALGADAPLAVPRWSATVVEPHVAGILAEYALDADELASPHAPESRLARASAPDEALHAIERLRQTVAECTEVVCRSAAADAVPLPERAVLGARRSTAHHVDRLERRLLAAVKRRETEMMHHVATARGALHPFGKRQERALNVLPMLARHGPALSSALASAAGEWAAEMTGASDATVPGSSATVAAR